MLNQINLWMTALFAKVVAFGESLKEDERGLSGVVVAVMLILVAVLAIALLWGFLQGWLLDLWEQITDASTGW